MGWLGSISKVGNWLGSAANTVGNVLGCVQDAAKSGINTVSDAAKSVGNVINQNAGALDTVGLGGTARYLGTGLTSGGALGNSIANLVGSKNLNDAITNGVDAYHKGVQFVGDVSNYGSAMPTSPLQK